MNAIFIVGAACNYPREAYSPGDLPASDHAEVWKYFERAAYRQFVPSARNRVQRQGLREAAAEAASVAYMFWLTTPAPRIPRGAHASALAGVRRFMERSGWAGRTGQRRAARRSQTEGVLSRREVARQRAAYTPASVAEGVERIANSPKLGRKAYRLARKLGLQGVRELVREACGFAAD